jgi:hypothetical protein
MGYSIKQTESHKNETHKCKRTQINGENYIQWMNEELAADELKCRSIANRRKRINLTYFVDFNLS